MHDLARFFALCPDMLIVAGLRDGLFRRVNPATCRALGWSEEELVSRSFRDLIHPDEVDGVEAAVEALMEGQTDIRAEYRKLRKDGSYFWTEWHGGYFPEEELLYGIGRDITERKQTEAALAAAQAERTAVLESIGDGFCSVDAEWRVTYANARVAALLNRTPEAMRGQLLSELIPKEQRTELAPLTALFERTMADRQQRDFEYFSQSQRRWLSARIYPRDDGGLSIYVRNITERKQMEETLRASQMHFEAVANLVPDLLWRGDPDGTPIWTNERWVNYNGAPVTVLRDRGWGLIHLDDVETSRASFEAGFRNKRPISCEYRIRRRDGAYRWFLARVRPLLDSNGAVTAWFGSATDIDDLKRAQGQQELLIAELQHRTRNLLGIVRSVAAQTMAGSTSLDDFAERLNSRLSALSRVQSFFSQNVEMGLCELLRAELAAHGIDPNEPRVVLDVSPFELPTSSVQPLVLGLHELTTNALKHGAFATPSGRLAVRCWMETETERPSLKLEWRESGVAMPDHGKPVRRGFGLDLIERGLPYQLGATTNVSFSPDGLVCNLVLPLAKAVPIAPALVA